MLDTVRLALGRAIPTGTFYECRHCGTSLARRDDDCPACDSSEVASYEV